MHRYSKSSITLPDFRVIGPSEILTWQTLPIFIVPKFRVTDLPIFVFTLPDFREIGSKKLADSKKNGQWDHGIKLNHEIKFVLFVFSILVIEVVSLLTS